MTIQKRKEILLEFAEDMANSRDRWQDRLDEISRRHVDNDISDETYQYISDVFSNCRDACQGEYTRTMDYISELNKMDELSKPWRKWLLQIIGVRDVPKW